LWDGSRGSPSIRYAVATLIAVRIAAVLGESVALNFIYNLIW